MCAERSLFRVRDGPVGRRRDAAERRAVGAGGRVRGDPEAELPLGELDEALDLGVVHEAVAVPVGAADGEARPQAGEPRAAAADGLPELLPG